MAKSVPREKKNNIDNITEAINLHANPKILQQKVAEATEPKLTFKKNFEHKAAIVDISTEFVFDKDNSFKGIFYQDKYMQNLFQIPENDLC